MLNPCRAQDRPSEVVTGRQALPVQRFAAGAAGSNQKGGRCGRGRCGVGPEHVHALAAYLMATFLILALKTGFLVEEIRV